jgi:hypothetical protein
MKSCGMASSMTVLALSVAGLTALGGAAQAQTYAPSPPPPPPHHHHHYHHYVRNDRYDDQCHDARRSSANTGTAVGAVGGGILGSALGGGRLGNTLLGAGAGALAGHEIGKNSVHC